MSPWTIDITIITKSFCRGLVFKQFFQNTDCIARSLSSVCVQDACIDFFHSKRKGEAWYNNTANLAKEEPTGFFIESAQCTTVTWVVDVEEVMLGKSKGVGPCQGGEYRLGQ